MPRYVQYPSHPNSSRRRGRPAAETPRRPAAETPRPASSAENSPASPQRRPEPPRRRRVRPYPASSPPSRPQPERPAGPPPPQHASPDCPILRYLLSQQPALPLEDDASDYNLDSPHPPTPEHFPQQPPSPPASPSPPRSLLCSICMDEAVDYRLDLCKHYFHRKCLQNMVLQMEPVCCPNCRGNLTFLDLVHLDIHCGVLDLHIFYKMVGRFNAFRNGYRVIVEPLDGGEPLITQTFTDSPF